MDGGDNVSLLPHHSFLKQQRIFCSVKITTRTWLRAHRSHVETDKNLYVTLMGGN
ncbi:hypothetical protein NC651_017076 [Populus alba x Populus x berolinensis]|nr:hypothetical protein NC651_017076 [Populus alba x Populus x berolinensis]